MKSIVQNQILEDEMKQFVLLLTVLGFGSSILWINDLAPGENQYGHEY